MLFERGSGNEPYSHKSKRRAHASAAPPPLALWLTTEPLRLLSPPLENPRVPEIGGGGVELEGLMSIAPTPTPEDHVADLRGEMRDEAPLRLEEVVESVMPTANGLPLLSSEPPDPDAEAPLEVVGLELVVLDVPCGGTEPGWRLRPMTGARGIRIPPLAAFTVPESSDCECAGSCG